MGQIPTSAAAAFYSPKSSFFPRLTRPLQGAAHVVHCKGPDCAAWCKAFARAARGQDAFQLVIDGKAQSQRPRVLRGASACSGEESVCE